MSFATTITEKMKELNYLRDMKVEKINRTIQTIKNAASLGDKLSPMQKLSDAILNIDKLQTMLSDTKEFINTNVTKPNKTVDKKTKSTEEYKSFIKKFKKMNTSCTNVGKYWEQERKKLLIQLADLGTQFEKKVSSPPKFKSALSKYK